MYPKSSIVIAAVLVVFSTFNGTYGYGGAERAQHDVEKPRFMQRNVKRQYSNTTSSFDLNLDRLRSKEEERKKQLEKTPTPEAPVAVPVIPTSTPSTPASVSTTVPSTTPASSTPPSTSSTAPSSSTKADPNIGDTNPTTQSKPGISNIENKANDVNVQTPSSSTPPSVGSSSQSQSAQPLVLPSSSVDVPVDANLNNVGNQISTAPVSLPTSTPAVSVPGSTTPQVKENENIPSSTPAKLSTPASSSKGDLPIVGGLVSDVLPETSTKPSSSNRFGGSSNPEQQPSAVNANANSVVNGLSAAITPTPSLGTQLLNQDTSSDGLDVNKEVVNSKSIGSSVVKDLAKSLNNIPASITSNGVFLANPEQSKAASLLDKAQSDVEKLPEVVSSGSLPLGSAKSAVEKLTSLPDVVASLTTGNDGVIVPLETGSVSGQAIKNASPKPNGLLSSAVSDGILPSGVLASAEKNLDNISPSVTLASGSVVANPLITALNSIASLPASITLSNGDVVANPALTALSKIASLPASITQSDGKVVANPAITPFASVNSKPASVTLSNGQVVANPALTGSASAASLPASLTLSDGQVIANPSQAPSSESGSQALVSGAPSQSVLALPIGSKTLSNGDVVPLTASASQPSPAKFLANSASEAAASAASAATASGVSSAQSVPENTNVATPASASGPSAVAQVSPGLSNTPAQASPAVQTSKTAGPTDGPVATGPQSYPSNGRGPNSQQPTAYDSNTVLPVESSIVYEPSSAPTPSGTQSVATGLPSDVPLVLYPPGPKAKRPPSTSLIQIGFLFPLNYDFVWTHEQSQRQIFTYLPIGVSYSLDLDRLNVTMQTLRAWDTTQDLHYITTLALMWIPSSQVDALQLAVQSPAGKFYNHPDASIRTLMSMVNTAIPVQADNLDDTNTQTGTTPDSSSTSGAAPIGGGINNSSPVKASSVGIGVGVVCGAAAYGAAMFFVARRYRKRRQSHARSPSMFSSPVMSHAGADPAAGQALMSGAMGAERSVSPYYDRAESRGSARSGGSSGRQQISAPVMAENSLGWN